MRKLGLGLVLVGLAAGCDVAPDEREQLAEQPKVEVRDPALQASPVDKPHTLTRALTRADSKWVEKQDARGGAIVLTDGNLPGEPRKVMAETSAWICHAYDPLFGTCIVNQPSTPAGMFDCTNDTVARDGETLFHNGDNLTGWCVGFGNPPAQFNGLGDWNNLIRSINNNTGYYSDLYQNTNLSGGVIGWVGPRSTGNVAQTGSSFKHNVI